jgi:hypothetical protein
MNVTLATLKKVGHEQKASSSASIAAPHATTDHGDMVACLHAAGQMLVVHAAMPGVNTHTRHIGM